MWKFPFEIALDQVSAAAASTASDLFWIGGGSSSDVFRQDQIILIAAPRNTNALI